MDGFLLKPFSGEQVRDLIASVRANRAGLQGAAAAPVAKRNGRPVPPPSPARTFLLHAQGEPDQAGESARRFLEALEQELHAIKTGFADDDRPGLHAAGHRLRTLAALVHATGVNRLAARLETAATQGDPAELPRLVAELVAATEQLQADLAAGSPKG
jgi:HPt (histidine-containing phosphotransfer) domain-containing protein